MTWNLVNLDQVQQQQTMYLEVCPSTAASWMVWSWLVLVNRTVWLTCIEAHHSFVFAFWRCRLPTLLGPCVVPRPLEPHDGDKCHARVHRVSNVVVCGEAQSAAPCLRRSLFEASIQLQVCVALFHFLHNHIFIIKPIFQSAQDAHVLVGGRHTRWPRAPTVVFTAERYSDKKVRVDRFFSLTYDMESRSF